MLYEKRGKLKYAKIGYGDGAGHINRRKFMRDLCEIYAKQQNKQLVIKQISECVDGKIM